MANRPLDPRLVAMRSRRTGERAGDSTMRVAASGVAGAGGFTVGFGQGMWGVLKEACSAEGDDERHAILDAVSEKTLSDQDLAEMAADINRMLGERQKERAAVNGRG